MIASNRLRANRCWMKRFLRHRNNTIWNWRSGLKNTIIYRLTEEATESIKNTPDYDGAALAKESGRDPPQDTCGTRTGVRRCGERSICSDVKSFFQRGCRHMLFHRNGSMIITGRRRHRSGIWSERKSSDVFFRAYIRICGSPQREHRLEAVKDMKAALSELEQMGVSFEELAQQKAYKNILTMTT